MVDDHAHEPPPGQPGTSRVHATLPDGVGRSQVTVLRDEIEPGEEA
ncbi:hypothetical protein [Streptomyces bottropensis]